MDLTIPVITGLAAADAVNPCVLAILIIILTIIFVRYPKHKNKVLLAGFAFTIAVYITYFFYGIVIIHFLKTLTGVLGEIRLFLYKIFGIFAILLGLWNVKDYIRPGKIALEIPMSWRPKVQRIAMNITSPLGSFFIGIFLTLFLLPCTIGPYLITGGILEELSWAEIITWLLYYNFIFVIPMIAVTLIVYGGFASVEKASGWRERNIKYLHLIAGLILIILGIVLLLGLIY
ncbi:MAG: cytochrome c biogenesis CcdA family protein [Candidatus Aenigmatarchaeota archaeon]